MSAMLTADALAGSMPSKALVQYVRFIHGDQAAPGKPS